MTVEKNLNRWFKEKWVDVSRKNKDGTHPPCGRSKAKTSSKGYPKCRPSVKVSSKTPKTSGSMSEGQKRAATKRKRSKKQGVGGKPTIVKAMSEAWSVLKARGAAKRREKDQRDLEEFAERRDKRFADGDVDFRSMVRVRAPQALAGVQHKNITFTNPDEAKEVSINPNATFTSQNANISRQVRDQARAEKERNRNQKLQSHFEGSGITGARKLMGDEGVEVLLPIRREKRPKHPYGLDAFGRGKAPDRGQYNHPSEAFNPKNIKRLVQEGFKPSPNQLLQLPEGQRTMEDIALAQRKQREQEQLREERLHEEYKAYRDIYG